MDYKILKGIFPDRRPAPKGWGSDVAGTVSEIGSAVTRFKVGDEIFADAIACSPMAEYCLLPEFLASLRPTSLSPVEAATIPLAGLTALQALRDHGQLVSGGRVCIFGGSGGVGSLAIQIAKNLGASHVATTSTNEALCKELGADQVINYRNEDVGVVLAGGNFDVVFDAVGGSAYWKAARKIVAAKGIFVTIAGDGGGMAKTMSRAIWRKFKSNFGGTSYQIFLTRNGHVDLDILAKFVEEGKLKPTLDGEPFKFGDEGIRAMLEKLMGGRTKGKLTMTM